MAWPGSLTAEEQEIVKVFVDQLFRSNILRVVQGINLSRGIKIAWDSQISAMFGDLAAGDVIPNGSGLDGAASLTKAQVTSLLTDLAAILTTYDSQAQRDKYISVIGAVNMIRE